MARSKLIVDVVEYPQPYEKYWKYPSSLLNSMDKKN
jgi:hypothetical protein